MKRGWAEHGVAKEEIFESLKQHVNEPAKFKARVQWILLSIMWDVSHPTTFVLHINISFKRRRPSPRRETKIMENNLQGSTNDDDEEISSERQRWVTTSHNFFDSNYSPQGWCHDGWHDDESSLFTSSGARSPITITPINSIIPLCQICLLLS